MIEDLKIIQKETYIRFDFTGEFSEVMGKHCIDAMVETSNQVQLSKVLLDCRKMTSQ